MSHKKCLVFGAHGAIGTAIALEFESNDYEVWRSSRSQKPGIALSLVATGESKADAGTMQSLPEFDAVVWAQGSNLNDSVDNFSERDFDVIMNANVRFIASKAALNGLVKSVALDLADRKILVNAVLPGVIDTPMTRRVLNDEEIRAVQGRTGFGRLVQPEDVAEVIYFLCSDLNSCITGQSIVADLGFSNVRPI